MDSQDIQPETDNRPNFRENIPVTRRIIHAAIGVGISILGSLLFFLGPSIIEETFKLELFTSWKERESHLYYSATCCYPFLMLSVIAALVGGEIGARKGRKYLGAFLGAVLLQVIYIGFMISLLVS